MYNDASNQEASPCLESSAATQQSSNTCFKVAKFHGLAVRLTDTHLLSQPHEGVTFLTDSAWVSLLCGFLVFLKFFRLFVVFFVFLWPVGLFVAFFHKEYTLSWSFCYKRVYVLVNLWHAIIVHCYDCLL